jgi:hypothetical protein
MYLAAKSGELGSVVHPVTTRIPQVGIDRSYVPLLGSVTLRIQSLWRVLTYGRFRLELTYAYSEDHGIDHTVCTQRHRRQYAPGPFISATRR